MEDNIIKLYTTNEAVEKEPNELRSDLEHYSSHSQFDGDSWVLDKLKRAASVRDSDVKMRFKTIPSLYKEYVKYFAIMILGKGRLSCKTLAREIYLLGNFFKFVQETCNERPLHKIDRTIIINFEMYLHDLKRSESTKKSIWKVVMDFFKTMGSFKGMPKVNIAVNYNPFKMIVASDSDKYIPKYIAEQIDDVFYYLNNDIPHHVRTFYWICRLIPSRINEVTTIPIECLKQLRENEYTLTLNMFKQNGGYLQPELRVIYLKYDGIVKYMIDLIKEQQEISKSLQDDLPVEDRGLLFTYKPKRKIKLMNSGYVNRQFKKIMKHHNVADENNQIYHLTSHQLRHTGITDRVDAGFSLIEIRDMTAHKSNAMLERNYIHPNKENLKAISDKVANESTDEVYFKGEIISDNPIRMKRLLDKPNSQKIGRLGICSDITGCKSNMYECFSCKHFIPNADELPYFKEQVAQFEVKLQSPTISPMLKENIEHNLSLSLMIVEKIENAMEMIKDESSTSYIKEESNHGSLRLS